MLLKLRAYLKENLEVNRINIEIYYEGNTF